MPNSLPLYGEILFNSFFLGERKIDIEVELETCDLKAESSEPPKVTIRDENLTIAQTCARYSKFSKLTCKNLYMMDTEKVFLFT